MNKFIHSNTVFELTVFDVIAFIAVLLSVETFTVAGLEFALSQLRHSGIARTTA